MGLFGWAPDYPDPNDYLAFVPGGTVGLRAGWPASAAPSLAAQAATTGAMGSNGARGAGFVALQRELNAQSPIYPLVFPGESIVSTANLTGIQYSGLVPGLRGDRQQVTVTLLGGRALTRARSRHPVTVFIAVAAIVGLALGISLVAFVLTQLVPGDPAVANLGQQGANNPAAIHAFDVRYGLDRPLPVQYLTYLGRLLHGDLGTSEQTQRPVLTDLGSYAPATAELALTAMLIAAVGGVGLGMLAALRRGGWVDQVVRVFSLIGVSIPIFWFALLGLYLFYLRFGVLPGVGRLDPALLPPRRPAPLPERDARTDRRAPQDEDLRAARLPDRATRDRRRRLCCQPRLLRRRTHRGRRRLPALRDLHARGPQGMESPLTSSAARAGIPDATCVRAVGSRFTGPGASPRSLGMPCRGSVLCGAGARFVLRTA